MFVLFDKYRRNVVIATNLLQSVNEADLLRKCFGQQKELREKCSTTGHLYESVHSKVKAQKSLHTCTADHLLYKTMFISYKSKRIGKSSRADHLQLTRECSYNRKVTGNYSYITSLTECSYNRKVTRKCPYIRYFRVFNHTTRK